jgi:hypothetical protein
LDARTLSPALPRFPNPQIVKKDAVSQRGKASRSGRAGPRHPLEDLAREVAVMRSAAHPNVVALREVGAVVGALLP